MSPLAAIAIAADDHHVDLAAGHEVAGGDVRDERVRHLGLQQLPGRQPGALEIGPGLVDPDVDGSTGVVSGLDDAQRRPVLAAGEGAGVAVGEDPERPILREDQLLEPERGQPAMILGRLEDDRVDLGADRVRDGVTVLGQVADGLVRGHRAIHGPAQVHRGRSRVDQGLRRAPQRRPACVRPRRPGLVGGEREPDRPDLSDGRRPAHDHLADREGGLRRRADPVLLQHVGQLALVDQMQDARGLTERRPEPGRRRGTTGTATASRIATDSGSRIAPAASADARCSICAAPTTPAAPWNRSPANCRKKRRRARSAPSPASGSGRRLVRLEFGRVGQWRQSLAADSVSTGRRW